MPRKEDVLYRPDYIEPDAAKPAGGTPTRDSAAVVAILRDVTAEEDLTTGQLVRLVSGHTVRTSGAHPLDVTVPEERDGAIQAAKDCRRSLRGPDCAKSLRRFEVVNIIKAEIQLRSPSWKFLRDAEEPEVEDLEAPARVV
jgi:hypothetical protein